MYGDRQLVFRAQAVSSVQGAHQCLKRMKPRRRWMGRTAGHGTFRCHP